MNTREHSPSNPNAPIAIVGIGCLFPRAADKRMYWSNIKKGTDAISEVPATHWRPEDYFDKDPKSPDMTYATRGGFLDPVDFNPMEFGIAPKDLDAIDTSQLLGMVAAKQALIDAGYGPDRNFDRSRVSVILGVTGTLELVVPLGARLGHPRWKKAMADAGIPQATADWVAQNIADSYVGWQENSFPGLLGNVVAGRISNRLDLGGTNCVVDAACASSLSAVHLACLELQAGKSDMAVSGGIDTFNDIFMFMCFSKTPALSATGDSKPFDANGDGTILGEGLGVVILKRLADAERDGDKIYAVIKGMGTSSDGKGNAVYAPSSEGQKKALRNAYQAAGVSPDTVELVEAHGTGTKVGDAVEVTALAEVYRQAKPTGRWAAVGSVKSQIGHTKAAAGAAGLIKAALALHNKVLPPTVKVKQPLEPLANDASPLYINNRLRPWVKSNGHPRRAGLSAFGFGGSNFHCVLEEYGSTKKAIDWDGDVQIVAASADSPEALKKQVEAWVDAKDVERLGWNSRQAFDAKKTFRLLAVTTPDKPLASLAKTALKQLADRGTQAAWHHPDGLAFGTGPAAGKLAFLFPGQGSQRPHMLADLTCRFPAMLDTFFEANNAVTIADGRLSELVHPIPAFDEASRTKQEELLRRTDITQPALGVVELGAYRVLGSFGVNPDLVAGHSFGELTALQVAGVFDADALFRLAAKRGSLMAAMQKTNPGAMLAVLAGREQVARVLAENGSAVVVANDNGPKQVVLSGSVAGIEAVKPQLEKAGLRAMPIPVGAAFHSSLVAASSIPFLDAIRESQLATPTMPVFSNTTAGVYPQEPAAAGQLLARQIAEPVRFTDQIRAMHDAGARTFVEVGPGRVLTKLCEAILEGKPAECLALDLSAGKKDGVIDLAYTLARLASLGHSVDLGKWENEPPPAAPKPALTVPICGANYIKPRTQAASPPPKLHVAAERTSAAPLAANPTSTPKRERTVNPNEPQAAGISSALQMTQQSLAAFQRLQEETARLHRQFLEHQEAAQRTLRALVDQQRHLLTGGPLPALPALPPAPVSLPAPAYTPPPPVPATTPAYTTPASFAPTANMWTPPAATPAPVTVPSPAPTPPAPVARPVNGARTILLAVVAEKTGYPAEMLGWDMALDTDLGIDSIKRVEILSALQEKLPDAPAVKPEHLGTLHTLNDIAGFLEGGLSASSPQAPSTPPPAAQSFIPSPAPQSPLTDVRSTLLSIVAEKTGYPAEMLGWDMALDTDLGIDSIKRVEILSALQEKLPDSPAVKPEHLGTLHTLNDIAGFLSQGKDLGRREAAHETTAPAPQPEPKPESKVAEPVAVVPMAEPVFEEEPPMSVFGDFLGVIDPPKPLSHSKLTLPDSRKSKVIDLPPAVLPPEELWVEDGPGDKVSIFDAAAEGSPSLLAGLPAFDAPTQPPLFGQQGAPKTAMAPSAMQKLPSVERGVLLAAPLDAAQPRRRIELARSSAIWLVAEPSSLTVKIAQQIDAIGCKPVFISWNDSPSAYDTAFLSGLVLVAPEGKFPDDMAGRAFRWLKHAAKGLKESAKHGGAVFATVTRLDGKFGMGRLDATREPMAGCLAGLAKTAALEWPEVDCKAIDLDPLSGRDAAKDLVDEITTAGPSEIGLAVDGRFVPLLVPGNNPFLHPRLPLEASDTLIVTGGGRGITAETTLAVAGAARPNIVLLGRSPEPAPEPEWLVPLREESQVKLALIARMANASPREIGRECTRLLAAREIAETLSRLTAAGSRAVYRSVDIRDARAVEHAVEQARATFGPITGIIHGAGVLADRLIDEQTDEQFDFVFGTKALGFRNLWNAVKNDPLKAVVLFSSSTGRFGRRGQVAYAVANEALNKYARSISRSNPRAKVVAINWGPWDGGMVTPGLAKIFASEGIGLIPLEAGAYFLLDELRASDGAVEVVALAQAPGALAGMLGQAMAAPLTHPAPKAASTSADMAEEALPKTEHGESYIVEAVPREPHSEKAASSAKLKLPSLPGSRFPNAGGPAALDVAFEHTLTLPDHPILRSHVINGKSVLPMALHMEWAAHAALQGHPGLRFHGFNEFRITQGIQLDDNNPQHLRIYAGAGFDRDGVLFVPVEIHGIREGRDITHSRTEVALTAELPAAEPAQLPRNLLKYPMTVQEAYADCLFHGEEMAGIESIEGVNASAILGSTRTSPPPGNWFTSPMRGQWITDPLAIDAAFQLMILWTTEQYDAPSLPCFIGRYRQYVHSFPSGSVRVAIRITKGNSSLSRADVDFIDFDGNLLARMQDFECVIDASLKGKFRKNRLAPVAVG